MRSRNCIPRPTYRFAMETTKRKLASAKRCFASRSPFSTAIASSFSSSLVKRGTTPISFKYMRTGSLTLAELLPNNSSSVNSSGLISSTAYLVEGLPSLSVIEIPPSVKRSSKSSICSASSSKGITNFSVTSSSTATPSFLWLRIKSAT